MPSGQHARRSNVSIRAAHVPSLLAEAIRAISSTRYSVLVSRIKAINELTALIVVAPEHLRAQLGGRSLAKQLTQVDLLSATAAATVEHRVTVLVLQSIVAPIRFRSQHIDQLDRELAGLVERHPAGPALLAEPRVGLVVAAQLLISWSHSGRVKSESAFASLAGVAPLEASSGQTHRHRLNRGGDRALNRAVHTVALTRMRCHPSDPRLRSQTHRLGQIPP